MGGSASDHRTVRFGAFEADLQSHELRKHGLRVRLQEHPFHLLASLLERPGEVVTREELRRRLWPDDTFVEFDHSLNTAIQKIRQALGDSASSPRFVETIPRRGYRFVAPVEVFGETVSGGAWAASSVRWNRAKYALAGGAAVIAVLALAVWFPRASPVPLRIAVLPLDNTSGDPNQEYFSDGMTDALISNLGKIGGLRVISRTSVMQYKETAKALPEIARELSVTHIVEGTVLQDGEQVRISVQLVDAEGDNQLWAGSYQRPLRNVLSLQGEVARGIAAEVRVRLTAEEEENVGRARPIDPEAYRAYLRGRYFLAKRTDEAVKLALAHFERAIEKQTDCAPAYSGKADSYLMMGWYDILPPAQAYPEAKAAAIQALRIDDSLAEAHTSLAFAHAVYDWDWNGAEVEFRRAIELQPGYAEAPHWYGALLLSATGRMNEAVVMLQRAQQADPLSLIVNTDLGLVLMWQGRFDEAVTVLRKTLQMEPDFYRARLCLGRVYEQMGMHREALAEFERAKDLSGRHPRTLAALGYAYAESGQRDRAMELVAELAEQRKGGPISAYYTALIYAGLGDKEEAFHWLEKTYENRDGWLLLLRTDPRLAPLRGDPRFRSILQRMNLPE